MNDKINNDSLKKEFNPSNPIISSSPELETLRRTEQTLQVGDMFLRGNDLIRVYEINDNHVFYGIKCNNSTIENPEFSPYGSDNIEHFLKKFKVYVPNLQELYDNATRFLNNEIDFSELYDTIGDSTSLVHKNSRSTLEKIHQDIELKHERINAIRAMVEFQINEKHNALKQMRQKLDDTLCVYKKQMTKIMKVIGLIELYLGIEEELFCLQIGESAPENEPIYLHQQVLYADEEIAITDNGGIDYTQLDMFDSFVLENYKTIAPEQKCIVVFKPRRYDKDYKTQDKMYEYVQNKWNHQSYFLIRNGENFYRICSEHIQIDKRLFPLRNELNDLINEKDNYFKRKEERIEQFKDMYQKIVMFLQGLIDRSDILKPHQAKLNFFQPDENIKLIYDDELALPTGRLLWNDYVKQLNESIKRGSRIVYCIGYCIGDLIKNEKFGRFLRYYSSEFSMPPEPRDGLYTVEDCIDIHGNKAFGIKYNPRNRSWYDEERKNKVTWVLDMKYDTILNYDNICLEDIDFYLNSRVDRKNYAHMIPVLIEIKKHLLKEQEQEDAFSKMMLSLFMRQQYNMDIELLKIYIKEAISWWKLKNIWKRPISQNDTKAMKMIEQRIHKLLHKQH